MTAFNTPEVVSRTFKSVRKEHYIFIVRHNSIKYVLPQTGLHSTIREISTTLYLVDIRAEFFVA
jgi:hypothetical protein